LFIFVVNIILFSIDNLSKLFIYSRSVLIAQNSVNVNTTVGDHPTPEAPTILHNKIASNIPSYDIAYLRNVLTIKYSPTIYCFYFCFYYHRF